MSFLKSKSFKYVKNLIIGVGAAFVLAGALFKIESWPFASEMLILGMGIEAFIFAFLGIIGPEPDYYWDKLYPGLADYDSNIQPLTAGPTGANTPALNGEVVEKQLGGMLTELQGMSSSLGSLKALQEADFSGVSDQVRSMTSFYGKLNEAMADLSDSVEDTKQYKAQLMELNKNIASLNNSYAALSNVYGNVIGAMSNAGK
jgi:hypothetical protein